MHALMRVVALFALLGVSCAGELPDEVGLDDTILMQAQYERVMAETYMDLVLRVQYAYAVTQCMDNVDGKAMIDVENSVKVQKVDQDNMEMTRLGIMSTLNYLRSIRVFLFKHVKLASEAQADFFRSRKEQVEVMALGGGTQDPGVMKVMYLSMAITYMKVQKVSAGFRMVASMTSWLEQDLDYDVELEMNPNSEEIHEGTAIGLHAMKVSAFESYAIYAKVDMTLFGMEVYEQYLVQGFIELANAGTGAEGTASFLEIKAETNANTKFTGAGAYAALAAPFVLGGEMGRYQAVYTGYQKYVQYAASVAGVQMSIFGKAALSPEVSEEGVAKYDAATKGAKAQFSQFSRQSANIDYVLASFNIYTFFVQPYMQAQAGPVPVAENPEATEPARK